MGYVFPSVTDCKMSCWKAKILSQPLYGQVELFSKAMQKKKIDNLMTALVSLNVYIYALIC